MHSVYLICDSEEQTYDDDGITHMVKILKSDPIVTYSETLTDIFDDMHKNNEHYRFIDLRNMFWLWSLRRLRTLYTPLQSNGYNYFCKSEWKIAIEEKYMTLPEISNVSIQKWFKLKFPFQQGNPESLEKLCISYFQSLGQDIVSKLCQSQLPKHFENLIKNTIMVKSNQSHQSIVKSTEIWIIW